MAQFVNIYPCDLRKGPVETSLKHMYLGDVEANRVGVNVTDGGEAVALSGTCSGTAILCNGGTVALTGVISGNQAYIDMPAAVYTVEGPVEIYLAVTASGVTTTLLHGHGNAVRTDSGIVIDPGTIIPSVAALISDIDDAVASIPADYSDLLGTIAPDFSSSTAYTAGQYVWYSGTLYRFTSDHAAGSWTGTDAIAAEIGEDVTDLKGAITGMNTATEEDEGKALKAKTVSDGKVTEWEFGDTGSQVVIDDTLTQAGKAADAKAAGDRIKAIEDDMTSETDIPSVFAGYSVWSSANKRMRPEQGYGTYFFNSTPGDKIHITRSDSLRFRIFGIEDTIDIHDLPTDVYYDDIVLDAEGDELSEYTFTNAGYHTFAVYLGNVTGYSPVVTIKKIQKIQVSEIAQNLGILNDEVSEFKNDASILLDDCSCAAMFETGGIASSTGINANASYVSLRTAQGIPRYTSRISVNNSAYRFRLYLYGTSKAMDYLGAWDGTQLIKTISDTTLFTEIEDVQNLYKLYPNCAYIRMVIVKANSTDCAVTDWDKVKIITKRSPFNKKKYAALGDSITHGFVPRNVEGYNSGYTLQSYAALAAMSLGMGFANYGVDNACVGDYGSASSVDPMVETYTTLPSDADFISVMGGANDIRKNNFTLGTMASRDTTSYYGALHNIFAGLYKKYFIDPVTPNYHVKIFGITPIKLLQTSGGESGGTGTCYDMEPLAQAMKEVANYYGFPCLDFLHESGINPELNQTVHGTVTGYTGYYNPYITDGTHPTQQGQAGMADILAGFMKRLV